MKKAAIPTMAGALFVTGLVIGVKGDLTRYKAVDALSPKIERSYVTGAVTNFQELEPGIREKISELERSAANHYGVALPMLLGGLGLAGYALKSKQ